MEVDTTEKKPEEEAAGSAAAKGDVVLEEIEGGAKVPDEPVEERETGPTVSAIRAALEEIEAGRVKLDPEKLREVRQLVWWVYREQGPKLSVTKKEMGELLAALGGAKVD